MEHKVLLVLREQSEHKAQLVLKAFKALLVLVLRVLKEYKEPQVHRVQGVGVVEQEILAQLEIYLLEMVLLQHSN
jgi:hypothetical protein